jgi:1,4-alpha-glucan branching enzyme
VLARDPEASEQVWSKRAGYPGDAKYLDFHHRVEGLRVLRVTGRDDDNKDVWDPPAAFAKAKEHAAHFVDSRVKSAREGAQWLVAPYDAELFGHWWLEGPEFLAEVCRLAARAPELSLSTASEAVKSIDDAEVVAPAQSSWGRGGQAAVWLDESNASFWPRLIRASEQMLRLARAHREASGLLEQALDQALRELLLAQASDWPFLLEAKTNAGYAQSRFEDHLLAFQRLAEEIERGAIDRPHLFQRRRAHNPFGWLDFRNYGR